MKKYFLFFDFDGVLVSWRDWFLQNYVDKSDNVIDRHIEKLNNKILRLIDEVAKTVNGDVYFIPISSWGHIFNSKDNMLKLFNTLDIKYLKMHESLTCNTNGIYPKNKDRHLDRPLFIKHFIKQYKPTDYIIFDDEFYEGYMKLGLKCIPCDVYEGITFKAIQIFLNYATRYWGMKRKKNVVNKIESKG